MLKALESDLANKTFTADALLTQTKLADFLIGRGAHYLFAVKGNRPNLLTDLEFHFRKRGEPDFQERAQLRHGRIESRAIWTTATLNDYLTFPHVGQAFLVERTVTAKSTGKQTVETAYGITSHSPNTASAEVKPARAEPRALDRRSHPSHPRLLLGGGPLSHPNRPRPREHHPTATLRHRRHTLQIPLRRRHRAQTQP